MPGYGGYGGFEKEALRQQSMQGRRFRTFDKEARKQNYHTNAMRTDAIPITPDIPPGASTYLNMGSERNGGTSITAHEQLPDDKHRQYIGQRE